MIKIIVFISFLNLLCLAQDIKIPSIEFAPKKYVCYVTPEQLTIDGKLNESTWSRSEWTEDFADIEGTSKPLPRFRTRAKMLWDSIYFYVAAELHEPDIWGNLTNRDDIIFFDNDFEIFIDPDGDTHAYSEFEMNALNTVWDLFLVQPYRDIDKAPIHGWDIHGLKTGVAVYGSLNKAGDKDSMWTVEIAYPWKAFEQISKNNVPPKDTDHWRINFSRVEWKTEVVDGKYRKIINPATGRSYSEDNWVWSPQGAIDMHMPEMWGYVQFSTETIGSKKVSFFENKSEKAKWFLRQIYYGQKKYYAKNGAYTSDLTMLNIKIKEVPGYNLPPKIECTSNYFEAWIISADGKQKITIDESGLTTISATNTNKK